MARSEALKNAQKRYNQSIRTITIKLSKKDADLIEWLDKQPSMAGYIRTLIRTNMEQACTNGATSAPDSE